VEILELRTGNVSLEFNPAERVEIWQRLEQFGKIRRERHVIHDVVKVGKVDLIYYHEWDEPCLISTSRAGAGLLREIVWKSARSKAA
jgi:hypothetical protein